jgi:hypothetical protein
MTQTITEWILEGRECLEEFKRLMNKNEHTREELDRLDYIDKKYGEHGAFIQAKKDNYDARARGGWGGFGAPNCTCHISPPCQACIDWTNYCDERQNAVETLKEPGCTIINHGCTADGTA